MKQDRKPLASMLRVGVMLRKVWGGNRTWVSARAQSVLMSVWRTCWQQGRDVWRFLTECIAAVTEGCAVPSLLSLPNGAYAA
jgi:hypothetical protein